MDVQKKLLIVDDEELNLDFFELMLTNLGFEVEKARDGEEALDKMKRFFPDLILLDNIMPRMTGWEFTKKIKSDSKFKKIPIIMFSALDDVKDKLEGFGLGIEDYITKPFNFSEVLARIRVVLRNQELFTQIRVRESRLDLAEELCVDMKSALLKFAECVNELDKLIEKAGTNPDVLKTSQHVRKQISELEARIEKTVAQWDDIKKDEIGLPLLETQYKKSMDQE